jgi:vacuolar-type H+-ATPase subunit I/STV1
MTETHQNNVRDTKKLFLNCAAWYAIIVPAVFVACIVYNIKTGNRLPVRPWLAFLLFSSSFVVGILLSMFGRPLGVAIRTLVFIGMLMNVVMGGLVFVVDYLNSTPMSFSR